MPTFFTDPIDALRLVTIFFAIGVIVMSTEYLRLLDDFSERGYYSWRLFRLAGGAQRGSTRISRLQQNLYGVSGMRILFGLRIAAAVVVVVLSPTTWWHWSAIVILALTGLALSYRQRYGEDGADQMSLIISIALALAMVPAGVTSTQQIALWFLASQAVLAYASAGVAKLLSNVWRDGAAVGLIVNSASYGSREVAAVMQRHPHLSRLTTWSVLAFEIGFVLVLVLPWPLVLLPLVVGVAFHVCTAAVMGLNNFVWSFVSTYPAVLFAAGATLR